jgi:hypothetical protein
VVGRAEGRDVGNEEGSTTTVGDEGALVEGRRVGVVRTGVVGAPLGVGPKLGTFVLTGDGLGCSVGVTGVSVALVGLAVGWVVGLREGWCEG